MVKALEVMVIDISLFIPTSMMQMVKALEVRVTDISSFIPTSMMQW